MNVLSTFSGVGGLDLGLHQAGWRHDLMCEADEYRRAVLAERFPGVPIAEDVRSILGGARPNRPAVPPEVGSPSGDGPCGCEWDNIDADGFCACCGAHIDDPDGLYALQGPYHAPGECRVPRLERGASDSPRLDQRGRGRERGWDWSWDSHRRPDLLCGGFPCQDLSVAGRRRGLAGERSGLFFEFARIADAVRPSWLLIENVPGLFTSNGGRDFGVLLGTLADLGYGVAWRVLDSRFFGVPQRRRRVFIVASDVGGRAGAERAGEVLAVSSGCGGHFEAGGKAGAGATGGIAHGAGVTRPLTTGTGQRLDAETDDMIVVSTLQAPKDRGWRIDAEAAAGGHLVPAASSVRRLTPRECERLQGFPDDWTLIEWRGKPAPDSRRYAACGDAVTVPVARWIGERIAQAARQDMEIAA